MAKKKTQTGEAPADPLMAIPLEGAPADTTTAVLPPAKDAPAYAEIPSPALKPTEAPAPVGQTNGDGHNVNRRPVFKVGPIATDRDTGAEIRAEGAGKLISYLAGVIERIGEGASDAVPTLIDAFGYVSGPEEVRSTIVRALSRIDTSADPETLRLKIAFAECRTNPGKNTRDVVELFLNDSHFIGLLHGDARWLRQKTRRGASPACTAEELVMTALGVLFEWSHRPSFSLRGEQHRGFVSWLQTIRRRLVERAYEHLASGKVPSFSDLGCPTLFAPDEAGFSRGCHPNPYGIFVDEVIEVLRECLGPGEREVVQLRLQGFDLTEIADRLVQSQGTSRS